MRRKIFMESDITRSTEKVVFDKKIFVDSLVVPSCYQPEMFSQLNILPRPEINYKSYRHWRKNGGAPNFKDDGRNYAENLNVKRIRIIKALKEEARTQDGDDDGR